MVAKTLNDFVRVNKLTVGAIMRLRDNKYAMCDAIDLDDRILRYFVVVWDNAIIPASDADYYDLRPECRTSFSLRVYDRHCMSEGGVLYLFDDLTEGTMFKLKFVG